MKLGVLINSKNTLSILGNTKGLKSTVAYRILKNIKAVNAEIKAYDETRTKVCEEYANKNDEGKAIIKDNKYDISSDNLIKVNEELDKLINEEVDIDIKKIKLEDIDKVGLSALEISSIEFMLDLKENKEEK